MRSQLASARVLLVGTGSHGHGSRLPTVPAVPASLADLAATLMARCGVQEEAITVLRDPATPGAFGAVLQQVSEGAVEVLVVGFVGHGLLTEQGRLYLATAESGRDGRPEHTAWPYELLRQYVLDSPAGIKVVILDCCFSGRAAGTLSGTGEAEIADLTEIAGAYVLTSAGRDELALAPVGSRHTAFIGALIDVLATGDPSGPPLLTLDAVFHSLCRVLPAAGYPRPRRKCVGRAGELVLGPNPAYRPSREADPDSPPRPAALGVCPYPGLAAFGEDDQAWFCGRERATARLVRQAAERMTDPRPLLVVGASGSGKTSLLRAGLLPAIRRGDLSVPGSARWPQHVFTPCTASRELPRGPAVLVVDQFEEVFTECSPDARRELIQALYAAADASVVVLAMRADFISRCADHPELASALAHPVVVGPMTTDEVRASIERPGTLTGLRIEPGLTELLLNDLGARHSGSYEAARLPLLAHALRTTWQHREGDTLTVAAYMRTGGILGALTATADRVLAGLPSPDLARRVLLRLVHVGDEAEDTRRRVSREELIAELPDGEATAAVLDAFAADDARLIRDDGDTVEITHEALIRMWPALRSWIEEDRASLLVQQRLIDAAHAWDRDGRDPGGLYRGTRLALARDLESARLGETARAFLTASEAQESAERQAARRRARRRSVLTGVLAALLAVALVATTGLIVQTVEARARRDLAISLKLLAQSDALAESDPVRSRLLAVAADRIAGSDATALGVSRAALRVPQRAWQLGGIVDGSEFSPDTRVMAASDGTATIRLVDTATGRQRHRMAAGPTEHIHAMGFSPDSRWLASGGNHDTELLIWNVATGTLHRRIGVRGQKVLAVRFSPDGATLAVGGASVVGLFDVATGKRRRTLPAKHQLINDLVFSRDGALLAGTERSGIQDVHVWDLRPGRTHRLIRTDYTSGVAAIAFSPDGKTLATGAYHDAMVRFWSVDTGRKREEARISTPHAQGVHALAYSPDGSVLAAGGYSDTSISLWDATSRAPLGAPLRGHNDGIPTLAFAPNGQTLLSFGHDGSMRQWSVTTGRLLHQMSVPGAGPSLLTSPGRDSVQVASVSEGGWLSMRSISPAGTRDVPVPRVRAGVPMAFAPGPRVMATYAGDTPTMEIWSLATGRRLGRFPIGHLDYLKAALSPDGSVLATGGTESVIRLWQVPSGRPLGTLPGHGRAVHALAFSGDGATLASGGDDSSIRLWDVRTRAPRNDIPFGQTNAISALALNSRGTTVAYTLMPEEGPEAYDRSIQLRDTRSGSLIGRFLARANGLPSLAFSADGDVLASAFTGYEDGSPTVFRLWDAGILGRSAVAYVCAAAGRTLTRQEWETYISDLPYQDVCALPGPSGQ